MAFPIHLLRGQRRPTGRCSDRPKHQPNCCRGSACVGQPAPAPSALVNRVLPAAGPPQELALKYSLEADAEDSFDSFPTGGRPRNGLPVTLKPRAPAEEREP